MEQYYFVRRIQTQQRFSEVIFVYFSSLADNFTRILVIPWSRKKPCSKEGIVISAGAGLHASDMPASAVITIFSDSAGGEVRRGEAKHPKPLSDVLFCRWMRERP